MRRLVLVSLLALSPLAWAGPQVALSAEARTFVDNDEMSIVLAVEREGPAVHELSQSVLASAQAAAARARRAQGIEIQLGGVQTHPVWGPKGRTPNWRVRAELKLSSSDFAKLGLLASELTQDMQLAGVNFNLSAARRDAEQDKLLQDAAARFKDGAVATAKAFGFSTYDLKTLKVLRGAGHGDAPRVFAMKAERLVADAAVPLPAEGGKAEVSITLTGTVELN